MIVFSIGAARTPTIRLVKTIWAIVGNNDNKYKLTKVTDEVKSTEILREVVW